MLIKRSCLALGLVLVCTVALAGTPASVLGTWTLSEQYYEGGQHNFHDGDDELVVTFRLEADQLAGTLQWSGKHAAWPAYPAPAGAAPIEQTLVEPAADLQAVTARYRVLPAPGDDTTLVVEERWRLEREDRLSCELVITFERDGQQKGGFTWHRVFTREASR